MCVVTSIGRPSVNGAGLFLASRSGHGGKPEHVSAACPLRATLAFDRLEAAVRVDEIQEALSEASVRGSDHRLRIVAGPRGQAADTAPSGSISSIAHA
jgi:hypothetical protein